MPAPEANRATGEIFYALRIGTNEYMGRDAAGNPVNDTLWFDVVTNNGNVAQYLKKGTEVAVTGDLFIRKWTKQDGTLDFGPRLQNARITLIGGKSDAKGAADANGAADAPADAPADAAPNGAAFPDVPEEHAAKQARKARTEQPDVSPY